MNAVYLTPPIGPVRATIPLASSKSESNRALIIDALTDFRCDLHNLSTARDTQTMIRLLRSEDAVADVIDAGTTMRFLTAYFAVTGKHKTLTGTPRMCERPIGILVDALHLLGADIEYLQHEGYPPLVTKGFGYSGTNRVSIQGGVSSQYISALLMIAPMLPNGIVLELTGDIGSRPYIEMTLQQMAYFGVEAETDWTNKTITVPAKAYEPKSYRIESDWSGASYWYSVVALADEAEVELLGLKEKSLQGDSAIAHIMRPLGVESTFTDTGVRLTKIPAKESLAVDFTDCPDLAQTVAVCCAVKGTALTLTGIESLKIKETNRVAALQAELQKIGAVLVEAEANHRYEVRPMDIPASATGNARIHTYDDHRMAMAFAPVAMQRGLFIEEPNVVAKSYPSFWDDFARVAGVRLTTDS
ncbi:3-phosphoshikimate 1-carboxyvinyltransferase [Nibrella saemangeumensis]|uniref:3-phosphoshikimate 1-carboxyvinyltransferase n=1 Tax=Nibrella saemangeumensis TaxID=1084526 RepID=A0ABP8MT79_9BACT